MKLAGSGRGDPVTRLAGKARLIRLRTRREVQPESKLAGQHKRQKLSIPRQRFRILATGR